MPAFKRSLRAPRGRSTFGNRGYGPHTVKSPRKSAATQVASKIIAAAEQPVINVTNTIVEAPPTRAFSAFALPDQLQRNLALAGMQTATPIQDQTIDLAMNGNDVIGLANTGTGKTAAFLIPILVKLLESPRQQALILAPTRELAMQINDEFLRLAKHTPLRAVVVVGGANMRQQMDRFKQSPHIVIATPGRLTDLMQRRVWNPRNCHTVVLDEVDRMLDVGFVKDIERILEQLPEQRHSLFFSATMPPEVNAIVQRFSKDPQTVSVKTRETAASVAQDVVHTQGRQSKEIALIERLREAQFQKVIVFTRTKRGADRLARSLKQAGLKVDHIHGDRSQGQRNRALSSFKGGSVQALIATDIAARGIDVPSISHVINYDLPSTYEDYVHRIGRTGRADQAGHAITFIDSSDHMLQTT